MVQIEMTEEQATMLREALETYVPNLKFEIGRTESQPYRERLKGQEEFLRSLMNRLPEASGSRGPRQ